ncbi:hypothetical protein [Halomonas campaniensis]|uniref:hypothetical protein n=1 Tax=Halomonas campaniensis TaxID=213554 RepID=UPI000B52FCBA|nr:hypothetical protein [Halomonas campaniensis]
MTAKDFEHAPGTASRPLRITTPSGETFVLGKTSNPEKEQDMKLCYKHGVKHISVHARLFSSIEESF